MICSNILKVKSNEIPGMSKYYLMFDTQDCY